jgi:hypothetical protein
VLPPATHRRFSSQPPQGSLAQCQIPAGKQPLELPAGEGPSAVDLLPATLKVAGWIEDEPATSAPPADRGAKRGQFPIPGRRRRSTVAVAKPSGQPLARKLPNCGRRAELGGQAAE